MGTLLYVRLIGYTAGTLLMLFWMVVILGYRRQRNFERVFFFLCLALFLFYGGSLLALNAQIYYAQPPLALRNFAATVIGLGLIFLPPLLYHLHLEFAETRQIGLARPRKRLALTLAYVPALYFLAATLPTRLRLHDFDFEIPGHSLGLPFLTWLIALALLSCGWERKFASDMAGRPERGFHQLLGIVLLLVVPFIGAIHFPILGFRQGTREWLATLSSLLPLAPLSTLIYFVQRHNFLNIGRQKNLLYAVSSTFVALLYLALVRRISESFASVLPPEATAAILLFFLVVFIEPLQRVLGGALRETARREMDLVHRLTGEIQQEARQGNVDTLARFIERRIQETFELRAARVTFWKERETGEHHRALAREAGLRPLVRGKPAIAFSEGKTSGAYLTGGSNLVGSVRAEPHGSALSGETRAALEFLCEQLPGALDLCWAIEEKVRLERELAERERLAALGQMAASVSHNLKNPLGAIKTILQVQIESPDLPQNFRSETKMVLEEISRLSLKLNQLLQFSRPAILGNSAEARCDAAEILREVTEVLRPEADRRGVSMVRPEAQSSKAERLPVLIGREALNDILSNLVVNALDAVSKGGRIQVKAFQENGLSTITVEDDGPGIPSDVQEKILHPFFTTKSRGTGLGLAIVARRVAEAGGQLDWESPLANSRGSRFRVRLPVAADLSR
jgi:signal transduction histidine kinase